MSTDESNHEGQHPEVVNKPQTNDAAKTSAEKAKKKTFPPSSSVGTGGVSDVTKTLNSSLQFATQCYEEASEKFRTKVVVLPEGASDIQKGSFIFITCTAVFSY